MLPYYRLYGEILNRPGANQSYYFSSGGQYEMRCNDGYFQTAGEKDSFLWKCERGNWTATVICKGEDTNSMIFGRLAGQFRYHIELRFCISTH